MGEVTPIPRVGVFIDPGKRGAVSGVRWDEAIGQPVALFSFPILGEGDKWDASAREGFLRAVELTGDLPSVAWIEIPGDQASWAVRNGAALRRRGQQDIRALSMRAGSLRVYWEMAAGRKPEEHQQRDWATVWSPAISAGKRGDGKHRIGEAGKLVPGSEQILMGIPKTCRVDAAEAFLGASAALILARRGKKHE